MASRHRHFLRRGFLRVSRPPGRQSRDRRLGRERHTSGYDGLESEAGQRSSAADELRNQYTLSLKPEAAADRSAAVARALRRRLPSRIWLPAVAFLRADPGAKVCRANPSGAARPARARGSCHLSSCDRAKSETSSAPFSPPSPDPSLVRARVLLVERRASGERVAEQQLIGRAGRRERRLALGLDRAWDDRRRDVRPDAICLSPARAVAAHVVAPRAAALELGEGDDPASLHGFDFSLSK